MVNIVTDKTFMRLITLLFPIWAIIACILAWIFPDPFSELRTSIIPLLIFIMFTMGLTLTIEDFRRVIRQPGLISFAVSIQYLVMPLTAYLISFLLDLSEELMIGMLLVGSSAGGTASNVICYLARANVALSVTLTMVSTLAAVLLMPLLTWLYIGQRVDIPVMDMLFKLIYIALIPVLTGTLINSFFHSRLRAVEPVFPLLAMLAIITIIAIIIALNRSAMHNIGWQLAAAVIMHNLAGLLFGYYLARIRGYDRITCRTIAIETGMQNSGLSVGLAREFFTAAAALPGAIFSIWHNISGSLLAAVWRKKNTPD